MQVTESNVFGSASRPNLTALLYKCEKTCGIGWEILAFTGNPPPSGR
jgi:hypothetical protein